MSVTVGIDRRYVALLSASCLCAVSLSLALSGCGGSAEVAKAPKAAQVVWGSHEEASESDAPPAASPSRRSPPVEVDLDAPAEGKAEAADSAAAKASAAEASPEPEVKAEAPAPEPPPAVEPPAAAPALDKELRAAVNKTSAGDKKSASKKAAAKKSGKQPSAKKSAPAAPVASTYSGPNPCQGTHFSVPRVRDACAKGGRAAAKAVMKDAISKALASGASLKCANCHAEQQNYTLKPDAVAQLERWLAR